MRKQSTTNSEYGTKRMMLVDNPQDERYRGAVVCYMYYGSEDGPALGFHLYYGGSIDQVIEEIEETTGRSGSSWSVIPDQIAGCADEWIAPVRMARNEQGGLIKGEWEKLEDGEWVRLESSPAK
jgi:hypothetical protein